jgi:predicted transglutaminase-like protease
LKEKCFNITPLNKIPPKNISVWSKKLLRKILLAGHMYKIEETWNEYQILVGKPKR